MAGTDPHTGFPALPHTVVRIRAGDLTNSTITHVGTGFFYILEVNNQQVPLIVSNKHVLCKKSWVEFDLAEVDEQGHRILGPPTKVRPPAGWPIFEHPDQDVDLAAFPLNPLLEMCKDKGKKFHTLPLTRKNLAEEDVQSVLHAATSVLMVGFPNGIMDSFNNLPVIRRGTLATPYKSNYGGKTDFVVDIAAFAGSSGSPVFAFFEYLLPDSKGNVNLLTNPRAFLIGVLHSGPKMTAEGRIVSVPVPTGFVARTDLMIHLGYCVKAFRIEELASVVLAHFPKLASEIFEHTA